MRQPDYPSADAPRWADVDAYFTALLAPQDRGLAAALDNNATAGLPPHNVSPPQGKFLALLVTLTGARQVLEIGTLGGYSTIWMARALPAGGALTTIEANPHHAAVARANLQTAGVAERVTIHEGTALEVLPGLAKPYDLVFIDADKPNNPGYLTHALRLSRPGTVILIDNVVRGGAVVDRGSADPTVQGVRSCLQMLAEDPRLDATALQTVGEKGWDGFALAVVRAV